MYKVRYRWFSVFFEHIKLYYYIGIYGMYDSFQCEHFTNKVFLINWHKIICSSWQRRKQLKKKTRSRLYSKKNKCNGSDTLRSLAYLFEAIHVSWASVVFATLLGWRYKTGSALALLRTAHLYGKVNIIIMST